ncbi:hypothetical protein GCM10012275_28280 [Longimycelium tulufanense]|uniref:Tail terminator n=1 Tax=Longimycelium tulufanense TaxID=907463 RepID=A0A8J3FV59_9PSEU|nr:hypothetical protein [Longimycelium tulufanense]GGM55503.1 hypothetical protein GCM10012275_28280 [Longimycelium tulufanense]
MASLKDIRKAIKSTLDANLPDLHVFAHSPDDGLMPALIVMPRPGSPGSPFAEFNKAMARGHDEYHLDLWLLVANTLDEEAQDTLDDYLTGSGPRSVREVIFNNQSLGLTNTQAFITGAYGYGGEPALGRIQGVGAVLQMYVVTSG